MECRCTSVDARGYTVAERDPLTLGFELPVVSLSTTVVAECDRCSCLFAGEVPRVPVNVYLIIVCESAIVYGPREIAASLGIPAQEAHRVKRSIGMLILHYKKPARIPVSGVNATPRSTLPVGSKCRALCSPVAEKSCQPHVLIRHEETLAYRQVLRLGLDAVGGHFVQFVRLGLPNTDRSDLDLGVFAQQDRTTALRDVSPQCDKVLEFVSHEVWPFEGVSKLAISYPSGEEA